VGRRGGRSGTRGTGCWRSGAAPGVAAGLVCRRLTTGRLLAVDRSPLAVARATARNAGYVADGVLEVRRCTPAELRVSGLDRAFSVDVDVFWAGRAEPELTALHRALRPGGRLFPLYGAGPGDGERITRTVAAALTRHGFTGVTAFPHRPDGACRGSGGTERPVLEWFCTGRPRSCPRRPRSASVDECASSPGSRP
jgi:SAM-dependent methyltransferase